MSMPDWLSGPALWIGLVSGVVTIVVAILTTMKWILARRKEVWGIITFLWDALFWWHLESL